MRRESTGTPIGPAPPGALLALPARDRTDQFRIREGEPRPAPCLRRQPVGSARGGQRAAVTGHTAIRSAAGRLSVDDRQHMDVHGLGRHGFGKDVDVGPDPAPAGLGRTETPERRTGPSPGRSPGPRADWGPVRGGGHLVDRALGKPGRRVPGGSLKASGQHPVAQVWLTGQSLKLAGESVGIVGSKHQRIFAVADVLPRATARRAHHRSARAPSPLRVRARTARPTARERPPRRRRRRSGGPRPDRQSRRSRHDRRPRAAPPSPASRRRSPCRRCRALRASRREVGPTRRLPCLLLSAGRAVRGRAVANATAGARSQPETARRSPGTRLSRRSCGGEPLALGSGWSAS